LECSADTDVRKSAVFGAEDAAWPRCEAWLPIH
jgi:hypothetical protein